MRVVHTEAALLNAVDMTRAEAQAAFGNPTVYMEKFLENPRHIEIQVLADKLQERDLSRRSRLLDAAPASEDHRRSAGAASTARADARIGERCAEACRKIGYRRRGHVRVPLRERRVLLHRDEHARSGRASGDRDDHRHRHRAGADPHRRGREAAVQAARRRIARATRSSAASTPKILTSSRLRPGRITSLHCPADPASASIRTSTTAISCRRITIR